MSKKLYTQTNMMLAMHRHLVDLFEQDFFKDNLFHNGASPFIDERLDRLDKYPRYYPLTATILRDNKVKGWYFRHDR